MKKTTATLITTLLLGWTTPLLAKQPNILWLTFEDTSADEFGCYGNPDVSTPNVDKLAQSGIQYMQAISTAPHCSPARSTLITGCYATTFGMDNHRRRWPTPSGIFYPEIMRKAGYYCTNNYKTDYNTTRNHKEIWDECGHAATYNSLARRDDQPFFAVFNANITHMSRLTSVTMEGRRDFSKEGLDPAKLALPPHVPDVKEMRSDYAFHLEGVQDVDRWIGLFLKDLARRGLMEDTIILVNSDHGGCLPRGKGFPFESGLRVPMVIHFPEKYQHLSKLKPGSKTNRLVGFVDFAPTLLSLIGVKPPETMQGKAFLGPFEEAPRDLQFGFRTNQEKHYDPSRTVTDGRWKYIRSYRPIMPFNLRNAFQWQMPSNLGWDGYALRHRTPGSGQPNSGWMQPYTSKPAEMLFDLDNDPYELKNLANESEQAQRLATLRAAVSEHVRKSGDLGFFPRSTKTKKKGAALYDWVQNTNYDLNKLIEAAEIASMPEANHRAQLLAYLVAEEPEIRFWGACGLGYLAEQDLLEECPIALRNALDDADSSVASAAAIACCLAGESKIGMDTLIKGLATKKGESKDPFYSALETLSWKPSMHLALQSNMEHILSTGGFPAKSVSVNMGSKPLDSLHDKQARKKGILVNKNRRPLKPTP